MSGFLSSAIARKLLLGALVSAGAYHYVTPRLLWRFGIRVPYPIEQFAVTAADGSFLSSFDCMGRPVLLILWGAWCPQMPAYLPRIERLKASFAYRDVCVVPASTDEKAEAAWSFARERRMAEPNYWGRQGLSPMYWGYTVPRVFLFGRDGRLLLNESLSDFPHERIAAAVVNAIADGAPRLKTPSPTRPGPTTVLDEKRETAELSAENSRLFREGRLDELDARAAAWRRAPDRTPLGGLKEWTVYNSIVLDPRDDVPDADYEARIRLFEAWASSRPASATPRVALGVQWRRYAWKGLGGARPGEAAGAAKSRFEERLERSRLLLEEEARRPDATAAVFIPLLDVARDQRWDEARTDELLRRGLALDPEYLFLYSNRAQAHLPRFGGTRGAAARFAAAAADARADGRGDELYALILSDLQYYYELEKRSPFDAGFSWPRARAGFESLLARRPDSTAWASRCARLALAARDKKTAREMFAALGGRFDTDVWRDRGEYIRARARAAR